MRTRLVIGLTLAAGLAALGALNDWPLVAQPVYRATDLAAEREALKEANRQAKAAERRSEQLEEQAGEARADAEKAKREAQALAARIQQSEAEIAAAEARVRIVAELQKQQRARLAERQQPVAKLTAALQNFARRPPALALVQPGSVEDIVHVQAVLSTVIPVVERRTKALRAEMERGRELRAQADRAARLLREGRAALDQRRQALARLETQRRLASRELTDSARFEEERALGLVEQARDIGDLMDQLRSDAEVREQLIALDGPVLRPPRPSESTVVASGRAPPPDREPAYRLPVVGKVVTGLGEVSDAGVRSRGLTIATRDGAQVVAPAAGRVAYAGDYRGFGTIAIIEHDSGWSTLITGMAAASVAVGDRVEQGDPIGRAGGGRSTITVELRRNGRPVDIIPLLG